jgi:hypothetical protein
MAAGIGEKADQIGGGCWWEEGKDLGGMCRFGSHAWCPKFLQQDELYVYPKTHILAIEPTFHMIILAYRTINISLFHG